MKLGQDVGPVVGGDLAVGQLGDHPDVGARDADGVLPLPGGPVGPSGAEPPPKEAERDGGLDLGQRLLAHGADGTIDPDQAQQEAIRSCTSKRSYRSAAAAGRAAQHHLETRGANLRVYACTFCGGFHLTSTSLAAFAGRRA